MDQLDNLLPLIIIVGLSLAGKFFEAKKKGQKTSPPSASPQTTPAYQPPLKRKEDFKEDKGQENPPPSSSSESPLPSWLPSQLREILEQPPQKPKEDSFKQMVEEGKGRSFDEDWEEKPIRTQLNSEAWADKTPEKIGRYTRVEPTVSLPFSQAAGKSRLQRNQEGLRQAMLWHTILDKPRSRQPWKPAFKAD